MRIFVSAEANSANASVLGRYLHLFGRFLVCLCCVRERSLSSLCLVSAFSRSLPFSLPLVLCLSRRPQLLTPLFVTALERMKRPRVGGIFVMPWHLPQRSMAAAHGQQTCSAEVPRLWRGAFSSFGHGNSQQRSPLIKELEPHQGP